MRQRNLFSLEQRLEPLSVDQRRSEPVVWIQRLAILRQASRNADIRVIPFHRGLNIIRTEKRTPEDTRSVAHDVGKTLLMRLLRYTLGEDWFAAKDDTARIRRALPHGIVVGEWFVAGELWSVVRPLNDQHDSASFAVRGYGWEAAIQAADSERLPISRFIERIEDAAFSELSMLRLKRTRVNWRDVLAWIARDCECGFRKSDNWRDRAVNPKGVRDSKVNRLIMQWLMGLMTEVESSVRSSREERKNELKEADKQASLNRERLQTLFDSLAKTADFSIPQLDEESEPPSLSDCADELRAFIKDHAVSAKSQLECYERESNEKIETLRLRSVQLEDQKTAAARKAGELRTQYRMLAAQHKDEMKRETGPTQCPAKEQCAWLIEIENNEAAGRMETEELHLERLKEQVNEALQKANDASANEERLTDQLKTTHDIYVNERAKVATRLACLQTECGRWASLESQVDDLSDAIDDLLHAEDAKATACDQVHNDDDLLENDKENRERQTRQRQIENCYTHVLTHVFDDDAEGIIEIDEGLKPKTAASLHAHGTALSAMARVISFELSCLLASMCGLGSHPRLLLHDGPREGEMETELFRILFQTINWLESISPDADAAFQYIITTADTPEEFSENHPSVAETLHGRTDDGLLLKKRF